MHAPNRFFVVALALLLAALLAPSAFAQKGKSFPGEPSKIFAAAHEVAGEHYTVTSVSREDLLLGFRTPAGMRAANGYDIVATFEGLPAGCGAAAQDGRAEHCTQTMVSLKVSKRHAVFTWGGGDAAARDFFRWLDEKLSLQIPQTQHGIQQTPQNATRATNSTRPLPSTAAD